MRSAYVVLRRPRITEKGSMQAQAEGRSTVVFEVARDANKIEIKNAVQSAFNVEVAQVRTMVVRGKTKRRGKTTGMKSNWKKAIVTLAEGHNIDFFGGSAV